MASTLRRRIAGAAAVGSAVLRRWGLHAVATWRSSQPNALRPAAAERLFLTCLRSVCRARVKAWSGRSAKRQCLSATGPGRSLCTKEPRAMYQSRLRTERITYNDCREIHLVQSVATPGTRTDLSLKLNGHCSAHHIHLRVTSTASRPGWLPKDDLAAYVRACVGYHCASRRRCLQRFQKGPGLNFQLCCSFKLDPAASRSCTSAYSCVCAAF